MERQNDKLTDVENRYAGYQVYDRGYEKIGQVDDLFVNESDQPEYVGVRMGFLGTRSTLVPWDLVRVNEARHLVQVLANRDLIKGGPSFDHEGEITPEYEADARRYYGLESAGSADGTTYVAYYDSDEEYAPRASRSGYVDEERREREDEGAAGPGMRMGDTDDGEFREHDPAAEGVHELGSDVEDEDELRVQRTEEELRAGTREREAGSVRVRKRVRTDRDEIGEDEVRMPVTEEEVLVEKRPVKKEEVRVRKEPVEEEEVVEEEVRRQEVEVDDESERRER